MQLCNPKRLANVRPNNMMIPNLDANARGTVFAVLILSTNDLVLSWVERVSPQRHP